MGVFQNPAGFGTRPAVSQTKALRNHFFGGICLITEVIEQLY
jgi:hypothetical protein